MSFHMMTPLPSDNRYLASDNRYFYIACYIVYKIRVQSDSTLDITECHIVYAQLCVCVCACMRASIDRQ